MERCGKRNASNSGSESWTGIGVVTGFGAVVLIVQWPHGSNGKVSLGNALLQILEKVRAGCKTRNQLSYNVTHLSYKALAELGKVEKTIYLCEYLSSLDLRYEVNEGLNVVERWNAANDFLCYGRQGIFAMNSREQQEVTTLSLQLLQNCLMLINTVLVERTIAQHHLLDQLSGEDR